MTSMSLTPEQMEQFKSLDRVVKQVAKLTTRGRNCANFSYDDAIQEGYVALVAAIQKYPKYASKYTLAAFAYTYTYKRVCDAFRRQVGPAGSRRRDFNLRKSSKGLDTARDRSYDRSATVDTHESVRRVFSGLKPRHRLLLRAYFCRSKTMDRIANDMNRSKGWVSMHIREALATLTGSTKLKAKLRHGVLHQHQAA